MKIPCQHSHFLLILCTSSSVTTKIKLKRHYRAPQELTTKTTDTLPNSQYDESSIFCSPEIFDLILRLMIGNPKAIILKLRNDMDIRVILFSQCESLTSTTPITAMVLDLDCLMLKIYLNIHVCNILCQQDLIFFHLTICTKYLMTALKMLPGRDEWKLWVSPLVSFSSKTILKT